MSEEQRTAAEWDDAHSYHLGRARTELTRASGCRDGRAAQAHLGLCALHLDAIHALGPQVTITEGQDLVGLDSGSSSPVEG